MSMHLKATGDIRGSVGLGTSVRVCVNNNTYVTNYFFIWDSEGVFLLCLPDDNDFGTENVDGRPQAKDKGWDSFVKWKCVRENRITYAIRAAAGVYLRRIGHTQKSDSTLRSQQLQVRKKIRKNAIKCFQSYICKKGENRHRLELDMKYWDALLAVYVKTLKKLNVEHYETHNSRHAYSACIRKYLSENTPEVDQESWAFRYLNFHCNWKLGLLASNGLCKSILCHSPEVQCQRIPKVDGFQNYDNALIYI